MSAIVRPQGVYSVERFTTGDPRIVIKSWLGPSQARQGLEKAMVSASNYGISQIRGWHRAHSQGAGIGAESGEGIRLAPRSVNLSLQAQGIEKFLRELRDQATSAGKQIHLTTVTQTHARTLRLKSIEYIISIRGDYGMQTLCEVSIEVTSTGSARPGVRAAGADNYVWGKWMG